jgi:L-ascorbate metabolism protein UlaG (beta-lactamase superfamily)
MDRPVAQVQQADRLPRRIRFLGHASVLIDLDDTRILADPLLRNRVSALYWRHPIPRSELDHPVDTVLISHMHQDHLDVPSLRQIGMDIPLLVSRRAGPFLARRGFSRAYEMLPNDAASVGEVRVRATHANHLGFRPPFGPLGGCLGFIIEGSARVYFAGDTDLFPEMADLGPIDVALLPVAGWGPTLGPGHMDARRAALALQLIRPKVAIPIHWGTFAPVGVHLRAWRYLVRPPLDFRAYAAELAPDVQVCILEPGEALDLDTVASSPPDPLEAADPSPSGPLSRTLERGGEMAP